MQKTNGIILSSKNRCIDYGVGTFIKQLSYGLATSENITVFILEIGITGSNSFSIRKQDGINILEIPKEENTKGIDSKKNQEKPSRNYVALEMLHCGLPAVASNMGGLKEIFIHRKNALLADISIDKTNMYGVAPEINQLTNHIYELLSDENLRANLSRNSIVRANKQFTLDTMIDNFIQTIKNLN